MAKRRRIAILSQGSRAGAVNWEAFWQGLRALGYKDQELAIESRWADGDAKRLPGLAAELVRFAPEVIVVGSLAAALATKQATTTIPIVVTISNDPVGAGLVVSLAHPGGNVTGLSTMGEDIVGKQLGRVLSRLKHTCVRGVARVNQDSNAPTRILLEQNDEWAVQRARYMTLETIAPLSAPGKEAVPSLSARASSGLKWPPLCGIAR